MPFTRIRSRQLPKRASLSEKPHKKSVLPLPLMQHAACVRPSCRQNHSTEATTVRDLVKYHTSEWLMLITALQSAGVHASQRPSWRCKYAIAVPASTLSQTKAFLTPAFVRAQDRSFREAVGTSVTFVHQTVRKQKTTTQPAKRIRRPHTSQTITLVLLNTLQRSRAATRKKKSFTM